MAIGGGESPTGGFHRSVGGRFWLYKWFGQRAFGPDVVDPFLRVVQPEDLTWKSMGEGPHARVGMEVLGLKMGPAFPAQQALSKDLSQATTSVRQRREGYAKSGLLDWVDWKEELWDAYQAKKAETVSVS